MSPIIGVGSKWRATLLALLFALLPVPVLAVNFTRDVGIGTTTPNYALTIENNSNSANGIGISNFNTGASAAATLNFRTSSAQFAGQLFQNSSNASSGYGGANSLNLFNFLAAPLTFGTNGSERMRIDSSGNVGIGISPGFKLDVNGTLGVRGLGNATADFVVCYASTGTFTQQYQLTWAGSCNASDIRLKKDIVSLDKMSALGKIMQLNPVTYKWANPEQTQAPQLGLVAQQVQPYFPEVVTKDGEYYGLKYELLTAPMIAAIQALKAESDDQTADIDELRRIIAAQDSSLTVGSADNDSPFLSKWRSFFSAVGRWYMPAAGTSERTTSPSSDSDQTKGQVSAEADSLTIGSPERPAGFTMYDIHDGRPHCVYLNGGNLLPVLGTCEQTDARFFGQN